MIKGGEVLDNLVKMVSNDQGRGGTGQPGENGE